MNIKYGQTKSQIAYGIRRTWANKLERQAAALRAGDLELAEKLDREMTDWCDRKYHELIAR